jgi:hypothetical protein
MRKRRYRRDGKWKYLIALAVMAILITYFAYPRFYSKFITIKFDPYKIMDISSYREGKGSYDDFAVFSGKLVHLQGEALKLIDGEGNLIWKKDIYVKNPLLCASRDYIVVCDADKGKLYGIDGNGEMKWDYSSPGKVEWIGCDKSFFWVKSIEQGKTIIEIINGSGERLAYLVAGKSEVVGVSVSNDGKYVGISAAEIKGNHIIGNLALYKRDGTIAWAKNHKESLILGLKITDDGNIIVLTEKSLIGYDLKGNVLWQRSIEKYISKALMLHEGVSVISVADDYRGWKPGKVREDTILYDEKGNNLGMYQLDDRISGIAEEQGYLALYSSRRIRLIDMKSREVIDIDLDKDIDKIYLLENDHIACVSRDKIYFDSIKR